ncbi:MAG: molybdate ABC transporter substrate-binding protein, partial [Paratractidigestivibacter faecalis]
MGGTAAAAAVLGLAACGGNSASTDGGNGSASKDDAKKSAIVVFAAASMTESLTRAGDQFVAANDQYELSFNYDSSGTLKTQIQEGADCDVFISAGQKQMNQMDITA